MVPLNSFYTLCVYRFERNVSMNVSCGGSFRDITKFNARLLVLIKRLLSSMLTSDVMENNYDPKASFRSVLTVVNIIFNL